MMYALIRRLLFLLDPETAHAATLSGLRPLHRLGALRALLGPPPAQPVRCMGLRFPNPVGLAAGLDKNGDHLDALGALGFGFVELGTVTPRPQPGNPRPRLYRLPRDTALINRFGFNNKGVHHLVARIRRHRFAGVLGINIGKNRDTPLERAPDDYRYCLEQVYPHADYVVINISSPNTPGLRNLQEAAQLDMLLAALKADQHRLVDRYGRYVPLVVKISPDLDETAITVTAQRLIAHGIDGVTATNTTLSREGVTDTMRAQETGGLSGAPLRPRADRALAALHHALDGQMPVIGVGGIIRGIDAGAKRDAGASLIQLYTGLIYRGPALIRECATALREAPL